MNEGLKKILIISYFFPPCNLTASQRTLGWARYLSLFGYYPIIVTRNWDIPVVTAEDALISTGDEIRHQKKEGYEVYYLPYKASKRDEIYAENRNNRIVQKLSKIITLKELLFESFFDSAIPSINMYRFSRKLIRENEDIKTVLISAKPFIHFKFGYKLNKEFGIDWVADYRDDWNTSDLESKKGFFMSIIARIQSRSEKKWVKSAKCITTISSVYAEKIAKFVKRDGFVILNGFDDVTRVSKDSFESNTFNFTYNGSLYRTQPIEVFLRVIKKIIQRSDIVLEIHVHFPGLSFHVSQEKRVRENMVGFEKHLHISARVSKEEVLELQNKSDVLIMISHTGHKGVPSSKLYEYIGLKKTVLLFPNDHDIVEETLNHTGLGVICENEEEMYEKLVDLILSKQQGNLIQRYVKDDIINFYSRENQAKELANVLSKFEHPAV